MLSAWTLAPPSDPSSQAYLQVFRRLLDEPLPNKPPEQKLPIWETLCFAIELTVDKCSAGKSILLKQIH